jgi:hypothetical protein
MLDRLVFQNGCGADEASVAVLDLRFLRDDVVIYEFAYPATVHILHSRVRNTTEIHLDLMKVVSLK